jgi:hypothetical protein
MRPGSWSFDDRGTTWVRTPWVSEGGGHQDTALSSPNGSTSLRRFSVHRGTPRPVRSSDLIWASRSGVVTGEAALPSPWRRSSWPWPPPPVTKAPRSSTDCGRRLPPGTPRRVRARHDPARYPSPSRRHRPGRCPALLERGKASGRRRGTALVCAALFGAGITGIDGYAWVVEVSGTAFLCAFCSHSPTPAPAAIIVDFDFKTLHTLDVIPRSAWVDLSHLGIVHTLSTMRSGYRR